MLVIILSPWLLFDMQTSINDAECSEYPKSTIGDAARCRNLGISEAETELPHVHTVATASAILLAIIDENHMLRYIRRIARRELTWMETAIVDDKNCMSCTLTTLPSWSRRSPAKDTLIPAIAITNDLPIIICRHIQHRYLSGAPTFACAQLQE